MITLRPDTRVRKFRLHRGRSHAPRPPADPPCPLEKWQIQQLGTFNAETARGIVHTGKWTTEMAALQRRYDRWAADCADTWNAWSLGISVAEYRSMR